MHADLFLGGEKIASAPLALIPNRSFIGQDWENALDGAGAEGEKEGRKEKLPRAWL